MFVTASNLHVVILKIKGIISIIYQRSHIGVLSAVMIFSHPIITILLT